MRTRPVNRLFVENDAEQRSVDGEITALHWSLRVAIPRQQQQPREVILDPLEIQTRAIIAAALIGAGAVEIPSIPYGGQGVPDAAGMRLRELTDYVYRLLTSEAPQEPE